MKISVDGAGFSMAGNDCGKTACFGLGAGEKTARKVLGVPPISILSRDPNLSRKPPETQEKRLVFDKNDGRKEWKWNQPLER